MKYHRRTLELIGPDLRLDLARGAATARGAEAVGLVLPAAVEEWYCVLDRTDVWRWYCGEHASAVWRERAALAVVPAHPSLVTARGDWHEDYHAWWLSHCEVWVNPPIRYDLSEWVKGPILPLMIENQGSWEWGVVLDGTPDPPAVICYDGTWDVCAESFSTYVYALMFDGAPLGPTGVGQHIRIEECVAERHRRAMREEFRTEPTTRADGGFTERFSAPGQRFSFRNFGEHRFSSWSLSAVDTAGFADLVRRLSGILPAVGEIVLKERREPPAPAAGLAGGEGDIPF